MEDLEQARCLSLNLILFVTLRSVSGQVGPSKILQCRAQRLKFALLVSMAVFDSGVFSCVAVLILGKG